MFEVARQAQIGDAKLGDVFAFCSGLYFRGKLAYGQRFTQPPSKIPGVLIITPSRGLLPADTRIGIAELREFVTVAIAESEARFTGPMRRSAEMLAKVSCEVVLLGSIATGKYVDCLLKCVARSEELNYIPVLGATRRGPRPKSPFPRSNA
jgi:hypothetical protein